MLVMPHGAAYARRLKVRALDLLDRILSSPGIDKAKPYFLKQLGGLNEDQLWAWVYFGLQYWPQLHARPLLTPLEVLRVRNLAALRSL